MPVSRTPVSQIPVSRMPVSRERLLGDSGGAGHAPAARAGDQNHARRDLGPVIQLGTGGEVLPGRPGPPRPAQLGAPPAAADPDQTEVPDARAPWRLRTLE